MDRGHLLAVAAVILCVVLITSIAQRASSRLKNKSTGRNEKAPEGDPWPFELPDPVSPKNWGFSPPRPRIPKKRDVSADEYERAVALALMQRKANAMWMFERTKAQAISARSSAYVWRSSRDGDVCLYCRSKDGKSFRWNSEHEHPGYHQCTEEESCRCYAEPIIPN